MTAGHGVRFFARRDGGVDKLLLLVEKFMPLYQKFQKLLDCDEMS